MLCIDDLQSRRHLPIVLLRVATPSKNWLSSASLHGELRRRFVDHKLWYWIMDHGGPRCSPSVRGADLTPQPR